MFLNFITIFTMLFSIISEAQGMDFIGDSSKDKDLLGVEILPFCKIEENREWIEEVIAELEKEGLEEPHYLGDGMFCFSSPLAFGVADENCLQLEGASNKHWALSIGDEKFRAFPTRRDAIIAAAYLSDGEQCFLPANYRSEFNLDDFLFR